VLAGAEPFSVDAGEIGVVLCHGFTGCPQSMRPWAHALADAGHSIRLPLLPGHGTRWQDLNQTTWRQWYGHVDAAFDELRARCTTVFAMGLSMGGALALRLAEEHGTAVAGVVAVNPYISHKQQHPLFPTLPVLRWAVPWFPGVVGDIKKPGVTELGYKQLPLHALSSLLQFHAMVRADLSRVTQPLLLMYSAVDHVVPAATNAHAVRDGVGSTDVTEIVLEDSYHVATLDNDAERIQKESIAFVARVAGNAAAGEGTGS
jgi:carboxylesterase